MQHKNFFLKLVILLSLSVPVVTLCDTLVVVPENHNRARRIVTNNVARMVKFTAKGIYNTASYIPGITRKVAGQVSYELGELSKPLPKCPIAMAIIIGSTIYFSWKGYWWYKNLKKKKKDGKKFMVVQV